MNRELKDTLLRIKCLGDNFAKRTPQRPCWGSMPDRKNIWRGCYDVWFTEQDRIDAQTIPPRIMQELLDTNLIYKTELKYGKYTHVLYYLTELGLDLLKQQQLTLGF
jgi:hypothetical protein